MPMTRRLFIGASAAATVALAGPTPAATLIAASTTTGAMSIRGTGAASARGRPRNSRSQNRPM